MSRIFDALKQAQSIREEKLFSKPANPVATAPQERRRSRRWSLDIPIYVYGHDLREEPFHEEAHTLQVNANGALLLLSVPVRKGQTLHLTNSWTHDEQECCVVFLGKRHSRTVEAGIAFPQANPAFWQTPPLPEDRPAA